MREIDRDVPAPIVVVPARIGSTRLPGKMLHEIRGTPLIAHTVRGARASRFDVVVATDDASVAEAAREAGADAALTGSDHASGTDRIAELAEREGWNERRIVVNVQGDEPLMPASLIAQVADALRVDPGADLSTAAVPIVDADAWVSPDVVKVVCDSAGHALYFSRASIPRDREAHAPDRPPSIARRHIGIYGYRVGALKRLASAPVAELERLEKLEQLRALAIGQCIAVVDADTEPGPGVDVEADLARVAAQLDNEVLDGS